MNVSASEAEEALEAIQKVTQKTRQSISSAGAYISLIVNGMVWLIGFTATQFLSPPIVIWVWVGAASIGVVAATLTGMRLSKRVRNPSAGLIGRRIGLFWLFLLFFAAGIIAIALPLDGRQLTAIIILFSMIGQLSMGLLLSFSSVWWPLPVGALVMISYFLPSEYFYLWMALLGGGGTTALGLYIRLRW